MSKNKEEYKKIIDKAIKKTIDDSVFDAFKKAGLKIKKTDN